MDRRRFLKDSALALGFAQAASAQHGPRSWVLENSQIAWHLEQTPDGIRSSGFENRISGRRFTPEPEAEFTLAFSTGQRIEIPWWDCQYGDTGPWTPVANLSGGQKAASMTVTPDSATIFCCRNPRAGKRLSLFWRIRSPGLA